MYIVSKCKKKGFSSCLNTVDKTHCASHRDSKQWTLPHTDKPFSSDLSDWT